MLEEYRDDISQLSVDEVKKSLLFITEVNRKGKKNQQK